MSSQRFPGTPRIRNHADFLHAEPTMEGVKSSLIKRARLFRNYAISSLVLFFLLIVYNIVIVGYLSLLGLMGLILMASLAAMMYIQERQCHMTDAQIRKILDEHGATTEGG